MEIALMGTYRSKRVGEELKEKTEVAGEIIKGNNLGVVDSVVLKGSSLKAYLNKTGLEPVFCCCNKKRLTGSTLYRTPTTQSSTKSAELYPQPKTRSRGSS
eukprot:TRINITY_DN15166_c0_g1_i2.p1 TRINITY_DN15166_c0_g1~~TRINITY_DN15166_c0_g1_i2.p1  ORF type:complete len:101 (-),score=1.93 TRINITY_DN15166_c0_g1_i2:748-1050(-)